MPNCIGTSLGAETIARGLTPNGYKLATKALTVPSEKNYCCPYIFELTGEHSMDTACTAVWLSLQTKAPTRKVEAA